MHVCERSQCASNRTITVDRSRAIMLGQWHKRWLLRHSCLLSRTATLTLRESQRRRGLCRSISTSRSFAFSLVPPLCQVCDHQEWVGRRTPADRGWISLSSRSERRGKSQRLLSHREGGVLLAQQRFASDDKHYRKSEFFL